MLFRECGKQYSSDKNVRHKLLHNGLISDDYTSGQIVFGSTFILGALIKKSKKAAINLYSEFMTKYGDEAYASGMRGNIFERVVLEMLPQGVEGIKICELDETGFKAGTELNINIPATESTQVIIFDNLKDCIGNNNDNITCIPRVRNYESFDVFMRNPVNPLAGQITVGAKHGISHKGALNDLTAWKNQYGAYPSICFMIPENNYDAKIFTKQKFLTTKHTIFHQASEITNLPNLL